MSFAENHPALRRWGWLFFAVATLFLFLGTRGLNEPDEGRYAEIGREMAATGEWLVPHLNGFEHFQKPPLLYWATALSIRAFGANEWAARLPSALAALGVVLLTRTIARRFLDREKANATALVLVSSVGFFALARVLSPDMTLTFWITAAVAAFIHDRRWLFFICMGLGFMTKGPMALVVPCSAALGWQFAARGTGAGKRLPWLAGLAISFAIGLSWFVALSLHSQHLFDYFWRDELVQRFASGKHGRSKPFWFFAPVIVAAFLPWSFFLIGRVRAAWQRLRARNLEPWHGLLLGWVVPPLVVLSCSGSKLPTYVLPLLPALALGVVAAFRRPGTVAWRIAAPATACWLAAAAALPHANDLLQQQASVRSLAAVIRAQPRTDTARIFTSGVRAHGLEFYLRHVVPTTRDEADIVLPTSPAQNARLFKSSEVCADSFADGAPAYGLIRKDQLGKPFTSDRWSALAQAGDFVLITNQTGPANPIGSLAQPR